MSCRLLLLLLLLALCPRLEAAQQHLACARGQLPAAQHGLQHLHQAHTGRPLQLISGRRRSQQRRSRHAVFSPAMQLHTAYRAMAARPAGCQEGATWWGAQAPTQ
jgi:hypothetical protein